jgi:hypothetical protein
VSAFVHFLTSALVSGESYGPILDGFFLLFFNSTLKTKQSTNVMNGSSRAGTCLFTWQVRAVADA